MFVFPDMFLVPFESFKERSKLFSKKSDNITLKESSSKPFVHKSSHAQNFFKLATQKGNDLVLPKR